MRERGNTQVVAEASVRGAAAQSFTARREGSRWRWQCSGARDIKVRTIVAWAITSSADIQVRSKLSSEDKRVSSNADGLARAQLGFEREHELHGVLGRNEVSCG